RSAQDFGWRPRTPPKRLEILRSAQDFGWRLGRRQNALRSFAPLRISAGGSDAAKTPQVWSEATEKRGTVEPCLFKTFRCGYFDCDCPRGSGATFAAAMFLGVDMYPLTAFLSAALMTTSNRLRSRPV